MPIRPITDSDLPAIVTLLCEGFVRRAPAYWHSAFDILRNRPQLDGVPQYGLALELDGRIEGVLLTIGSEQDGQIYCNLSSWYVRPDHRRHSIFMLKRALRSPEVVYTDISPAQTITEMIGKLGFRTYTGGAFFLDARAALRRGNARVGPLTAEALAAMPAELSTRVRQHLDYGCYGLLLDDGNGAAEPLLFRTKWLKKAIPAARFVYGDPGRVVSAAGPVMRALLWRGFAAAIIDRPADEHMDQATVMPHRDLRYVLGDTHPTAGDLLDTELALFGP